MKWWKRNQNRDNQITTLQNRRQIINDRAFLGVAIGISEGKDDGIIHGYDDGLSNWNPMGSSDGIKLHTSLGKPLGINLD